MRLPFLLSSALLWSLIVGSTAAAPLPVAALDRDTPVRFQEEILPALRKNCLACHNETKAKAGLVLETPEAILRGGDTGPAVVPGDPDASLLFTTAAHLEDPVMPPAQNTSRAENLSSDQLALLRLWILQGAKGASSALATAPQTWQRSTLPAVYSLTLSPDGRFAACGRGHTVHVYDLRSGTLAARLADSALEGAASHLDLVQSLAFSPDGTLASGGFREVKLWQRAARGPLLVSDPAAPAEESLPAELTAKLTGLGVLPNPPPQMARASADGTRVILVSPGQAPLLLDGSTGKSVATLDLAPAVRTALDALGREEAMAKRLAALHTAELPKLEETLKKEEEAAVQAGTALPAARIAAAVLATETDDLRHAAALLDARLALLPADAPERKVPADELAKLEVKLTEVSAKLAEARRTVELTERNRQTGARLAGDALARLALARTRKAEAEASLIALAEGRKSLETALATAQARTAKATAFASSGTWLALGLESGEIFLYRADTGAFLESFAAPAGLTGLRAAGDRLESTHGPTGRFAWDWEPAWTVTGRIGDGSAAESLEDRVTALAFSPDGSRLVTGSGAPSRSGVIQAWDVAANPAKPQELARNRELHRDTVISFAFSPDGSRFASASTDGLAKIIRLEGLEPLRSLEAHTGHVLDVDWSHDGRLLATAGADQQVKLWDAESGETIRSLTGWGREVTAVAFLSPASEQLVTASGDKTVKIDAAPLGSAVQFIHTAAVTPDGARIITGDDTGTVQVWSVASRKPEFTFGPEEAPPALATAAR